MLDARAFDGLSDSALRVALVAMLDLHGWYCTRYLAHHAGAERECPFLPTSPSVDARVDALWASLSGGKPKPPVALPEIDFDAAWYFEDFMGLVLARIEEARGCLDWDSKTLRSVRLVDVLNAQGFLQEAFEEGLLRNPDEEDWEGPDSLFDPVILDVVAALGRSKKNPVGMVRAKVASVRPNVQFLDPESKERGWGPEVSRVGDAGRELRPEQRAFCSTAQVVGYPLNNPTLLVTLANRCEATDKRAVGGLPVGIAESVDVPGGFWGSEVSDVYSSVAERTQRLARHLVGLFPYRAMAPLEAFRWPTGRTAYKGGTAFVDLNPRTDGLSEAIYYVGPGRGMAPFYLFESFARVDDFDQRFAELQRRGAERQLGIEELIEDYPRACSWFRPELARVIADADIANADIDEAVTFDDPAGARLLAAHGVALEIAEVLIARASADQRPLSSEAAARALTLATDDSYPPFVVVRLLAMALSGQDPKTYATKIIDGNLGVPLTRRWATMVLEGYGPFASSEPRRFGFRGEPVDVGALLLATQKAQDTVLASKKLPRQPGGLGRRRAESPRDPSKSR